MNISRTPKTNVATNQINIATNPKLQKNLDIDFNNKNIEYYFKALSHVIEKAVAFAPEEVKERLKALSKIEVLLGLAVLAFATANPVLGPWVAGFLAALGLADVVKSLSSIVGGVVNAKSIHDLDSAGKTLSKLGIDAVTKLLGAVFAFLKNSTTIINQIEKLNPGLASQIQKMTNQLPKPSLKEPVQALEKVTSKKVPPKRSVRELSRSGPKNFVKSIKLVDSTQEGLKKIAKLSDTKSINKILITIKSKVPLSHEKNRPILWPC